MVKHILFCLSVSSLRGICSGKIVVLLIAAMAIFISPDRIYAQETLQPGEAYATRFSGATVEDGTTIIDIDGVVGSIIDIRHPGESPKGQYWRSAPQRKPVTAGEVGQLFGIAFDDASPPNLYLTATSAYGLHRNADNSDWMKGMWGSGGGPGSVWKLSAANDYTPRLFADIKLNGRVNTGAALGNIAYDRWSRQLYVSDLESGMIHRLDLADGKDLGYYDHGAKGRKSFNDAVTGKLKSLKTNAFSATSKARTRECHEGLFENSPTCWNFADFRRRVWGLVVRKDKITQEVRLYYSVWGGHGFGVKAWEKAGDDRRNAIWSVKIPPDGSFDTTDIKREVLLPDFFVDKKELERFGTSHPVSDIAFDRDGGQEIMLLAERGGARNLGLKNEDAFASPHEARVLRYELDSTGVWQFKGRYDVGFYDRNNHGQPYLHANSSGGVDFGYGYTEIGDINLNEPGNTVWMTGDALCSPAGRCFSTLTGEYTDASQVHGLQGTPGGSYGENLPDAATHPYPKTGAPYPAPGLEKSIMIDTDINVDAIGKPIKSRISRNDATRIGDVEVYAPSEDTADAATPGVSGHPSDVIPVSPSGPGYPSTPGYSPGGTTTPLGSSKWGGGVTPPVPPPGGSKWGGGKPKVKIDLIINKKLVGGSCLPGGKCKFKITVKNVGEKDYKGAISFYDKLPIGWTFDSHHGGLLVWICQPKGGNTFTCKFHPGVPLGAGNWFGPGDSASVTITVNVPANAKGPIAENCASIIDNPKVPQDKGAKANDKDCVKITLPGPQKTGSDLEMKKDIVGMIPGCQPNSVCKFEITITNKGPDPYVQAVVFEDAMPVGWQFSKQTGAEWQTCSINGRIIRCETTPTLLTTPPTVTLKVNETIKLGLELKTPPAKANSQKVWNCAKVFPHVTADDTTGGNDKSCILLDLPGDLSLKKKPLITIEKTKANNKKCGGAFSDYCDYHFLVRNMGKATFKGPISIIDNNIPGVTYHSHTPNPPIWNCKDIEGGQTGKIRCDYQNGINVTLPPDATKFLYPLTLTVKWPQWPPQLKFIPNCATAIWPQGTSAKHCISVPVAESGGTVTGSASWAVFTFDSSGTKVCTPPNCSFFEFTASLEKTDEAQVMR